MRKLGRHAEKLSDKFKRSPKKPENPPVNLEVESRIQSTKAKTESIYRISKLSIEQFELLQKMQSQYPVMTATLERYEISTKGMPTWEQIKKGLTPEVLDKALMLAEPVLLLVPPTTSQSKVDAIDKHPAKNQKSRTIFYEPQDNDRWKGGNPKTENAWRIEIVEGVQDVAQDNEIYDGKRSSNEMSKLWVKKYENQGLDVINDVDTYLMLVMRGFVEDKPVDIKYCTVINGKNLTMSSAVSCGNWRGKYWNGLCLGYIDPGYVFESIRLRGLVEVPYSEAE